MAATALLIVVAFVVSVCKSQGFRFSLDAKRRMARKRRETVKKNAERSAVDPEERREAAGEDVKPDRLSGRDLKVKQPTPSREPLLQERMKGIEDNGDVTDKQASYIRSLLNDSPDAHFQPPRDQQSLEEYGETRRTRFRNLEDNITLLNLIERPRNKDEASSLINDLSNRLNTADRLRQRNPEKYESMMSKLRSKFGEDFSGINKAINDRYNSLPEDLREKIFAGDGREPMDTWTQYVAMPVFKV